MKETFETPILTVIELEEEILLRSSCSHECGEHSCSTEY